MNRINDELIQILRKNTPSKENTVDLLIQIMPMGKEAAYRRLRGEIPFTLEEAATICNTFKTSLDTICGRKLGNTYDFHLNAIFSKDPMHEYSSMLHDMKVGVEKISEDPESYSYRAYRALPVEFFLKYDSLSKIYIYILFYQLYAGEVPGKLKDIYIPQKIFTAQQATALSMQNIKATLIMDKNIFSDFISIVKYFNDMDMLLENDYEQIKEDLHNIMDDLERCAASGQTLTNKQLDMYVSSISFDATYSYIEGAGIKSCSTSLYCIDHLSCENDEVTENHKLWIKSLIRFSTQISVSGELQRTEYFSTQRKAIDEL